MTPLDVLFANNRQWAAQISKTIPDLFSRLTQQQDPDFLWIGCSDSRIPANEILGLLPGELFVHRNVANLVSHTDMNCLSVLQYAIENLHVRHIIVCGHYDCGGVKAILDNKSHGLIENWLCSIHELSRRHSGELDRLPSQTEKVNRLCELNVIEQVKNVGNTTVVRDAWKRGQEVSIYGWIYAVSDGLLRDLHVDISSMDDLKKVENMPECR